jgi:hypothetical protein
MLRSIGTFLATGILAGSFASASAQLTPIEAIPVSCPSEMLSIYYARGDATPSAQAKVLFARIGDEAARCQPDGVDLITNIDTSADGGHAPAIALALTRLNTVAEALIAQGVPADRIRLAAQANTDVMRAPMGEVGVIFRKSGASADDVSTPTKPVQVQPTRDAI